MAQAEVKDASFRPILGRDEEARQFAAADEKPEVELIDNNSSTLGPSASEVENSAVYKRAKWKVDFLVTGLCMLLYLMAFLDKSNLGNAKVAGLQKDLKLTSKQYSIALTILYPPYIMAELPCNLLLKRIGPHIVLPTLTVCFGFVCAMQGLVNSYHGLLVARFFVGLTEGGLIPAIVLYTSSWYKRSEFQLRAAWLFSFSALAGAFAGLLAAAIINLDGVHGIAGWKWIFIIEGVAACGIGLITFFIMSPNIESAKWLNAEEKHALNVVLKAAGRDAEIHGHFTWKEVFEWRKSVFAVIYLAAFFGNGCVLFGLAYFVPTIVGSFGYSSISTQLHTVPIYVVVFFVSIIGSWYCDRNRIRGYQFIVYGLISAAGYIIALCAKADQKNLRYGGLFLQAFGGYCTSPPLSAWLVDNLAPYYKRGTGIALAFCFTQMGAILSTWIYPASQAPLYHTGGAVSLMAALLQVVVPGFLMLYLRRQNNFKAKRREELAAQGHVYPDGPIDDRDPRFVYSI